MKETVWMNIGLLINIGYTLWKLGKYCITEIDYLNTCKDKI